MNDFLQKKLKRAFVTFSRPEDAAAVLSFLKQKPVYSLRVVCDLSLSFKEDCGEG